MTMQGNACFFSWALSKCLAPSTWKSITPLKSLGASIGLNSGHYQSQSNFIQTYNIYYIYKSESAMKWSEDGGGPIYSFTTSDIQRKVISTRIVSSPRFPLSAPQQINEWAAHTNPTSFWVQTWKQRGNVKRSALGECSPLEKDTRVETANEGRLSSQICSERVDGGSTIKLTHQGTSHTTNFTKSRWSNCLKLH
jgi:hypothetical protein